MREVQLVTRSVELDKFIAYDCYDFPYYDLVDSSVSKSYSKFDYIKGFGTYDIETTTVKNVEKPYGFMYHWQICLQGILVYGRTWKELKYFLDRVISWLDVSPHHKLVIYVHNLAYEYEFTFNFMLAWYGGFTVFASNTRKPIKWSLDNGIEFRCSYILSNMSLEKATIKEKGVLHPKAVNDLDYSCFRLPNTYLDDIEFGYCMSDVLSLYEFIYNRLINDNDTIYSIPLTSTGYVRRDCRNETRKDRNYRKNVFKKTRVNSDVYKLLKEAARGGNTHANRSMAGSIWYNVDSFDVASSYPYQCYSSNRYPMTSFEYYGVVESFEELQELMKNYCCIFRVTLRNVHLKAHETMPYLDVAHCRGLPRKPEEGYLYDNGRILDAKYLDVTLTEIDFQIILRQYEFDADIYVRDMYTAKRGYLPKPIRDTVLSYFEAKSKLKYDKEHALTKEEYKEIDYFYQKAKGLLNGIFGMTYTDPVRDEIVIDFENGDQENGFWTSKKADIDIALEKYYNGRNNFLCYAWGVYTTALAREHLQKLLDATGELTIYTDTDSSKAIMSMEGLERVENLNKEIRSICDKCGAYFDYHGTRYYMGVYEKETKVPYKSFKTLGAKKYCYEDEKGLHVTISGVSKEKGASELKSIDNFELGFTFHDSAAIQSYYNDEREIRTEVIEGCEVEIGSNIGMVDGTYTIGMTNEYIGVLMLYGGKVFQ